jgi:protein TonB
MVDTLMTGFAPSTSYTLEELAWNRSRARTRKIKAGTISLLVHAALIAWAVLTIHQIQIPLIDKSALVFLNSPIPLPFGIDAQSAGGGGGGGRNEPAPAATGRLPETMRRPTIVPDPDHPVPLMAAENLTANLPAIQMQVDFNQDESLPIGDISAPPNGTPSFGPGSGDGIGDGHGQGVGPGNGLGIGPGSKLGWGDGPGGVPGRGKQTFVVANGIRAPVPLLQPLPDYTDQARKAHIEGIIVIQAVVRKNGTVEVIRVLRGLGYGLDESAIGTISRKWRFTPGTLNGIPVDVIANIEVSFRLF